MLEGVSRGMIKHKKIKIVFKQCTYEYIVGFCVRQGLKKNTVQKTHITVSFKTYLTRVEALKNGTQIQ